LRRGSPLVVLAVALASCAASGAGIIGSMAAQSRFDDCMADAKAKGYRVQRQE